MGVGFLTALVGGIWALQTSDFKAILAYSTVSQLGFLMMGIGAGHPSYAFFHLIVHGIAKAGLFLAAGLVIVKTHQYLLTKRHTYPDLVLNSKNYQDLRLIGSLWTTMPQTMLAILLCAASLAGLPLFIGFVSKDLLLEGFLNPDQNANLGIVFLVMGSLVILLTGTYLSRLVGLLLLPSVLKVERNAFRISLLWVIPLTLGIGGLFIWHTFNPFKPELFWLGLKHQDFPTVVPIPLLASLLSLLGIGTGLIIARNQRINWLKESFSNGTLIPSKPLLNDQIIASLGTASDWASRYIAGTASTFDKFGIEKTILFASKGLVVAAHFLNIIERHGIDGTVKFTQWLSIRIGRATSKSSTIQGALGLSLMTVLLLALYYLW
jgi:NADH-quinone oxidoreductase subunit L